MKMLNSRLKLLFIEMNISTGISPEAMDYLIKRRNIVGIGIDTSSVDAGSGDVS